MTHDAPIETSEAIPTRIHQVLDRWVREQPQAPAQHDTSVCLTCVQVDAASRAAAVHLAAPGVRAADRVLVVGENCAALGELVMATSRIDACVMPRPQARCSRVS